MRRAPIPGQHRASKRHAFPAIVALSLPLILTACSDDDDDEDDTVLSSVSAATGGEFSSSDGNFTVTIPPNALSADTDLIISETSDDGPMGTMEAAGSAYLMDFADDVDVNSMLTIKLKVDDAPTHPEIGEVAMLMGGEWQRAQSSFYRPDDMTVVSLTESEGTYIAANRTLQREPANSDGVLRGRTVFMEETFGNEAFFGDVVGLQDVLNSVAPVDAVGLGVRVDLTKVPQGIVDVLTGSDFTAKTDALGNPAITRALLQADAVVGVRAEFDDANNPDMATTAGITCALCHVNVETNEFELTQGQMTPLPIGAPMYDGMPNLDIDVGAILALTPFAQNAGAPVVDTLNSYGPGRFDVRALPDNPLEDNVNNPTSYPPLWNFVDLEEQDYAYNWDGLFKNAGNTSLALASQAEAVYDLVMHANGAFGTDTGTIAPQLSITPPQALLDALATAEADAPGNVITEQALMDVQMFEKSMTSPAPGDFDVDMAEEGFMLFNDETKGNCVGCHQTAEFTGPVVTADITLNTPEGGLANGIKTPGLRGVSYTAPYFHDGSAETLDDVIDVYAGRITPALTDDEKAAIAEYLKSL